jgi:hypothetical protein
MSLPNGIKNINYLNGINGTIMVSYTDTVNNVTYYAGRFKNIILLDDSIIDVSNIFGINNNTNEIFRLGIPNFNGVMDLYSGDYVNNIYVDTKNNILYVIGRFRLVNDSTTTSLDKGYQINFFATWDIVNKIWIKPGLGKDFNDVISKSIFDEDKKLIYLGGSFRNGSINSYLTIYDMTTQNWMVGINNIYVNNRVLALFYDKQNVNLYVGGSFTMVNDARNNIQQAYRIAILNTNNFTWSVLGNSTSNGVDMINKSVSPSNEVNKIYKNDNLIIFSGYFTQASDSTGTYNIINNTAGWNLINNKLVDSNSLLSDPLSIQSSITTSPQTSNIQSSITTSPPQTSNIQSSITTSPPQIYNNAQSSITTSPPQTSNIQSNITTLQPQIYNAQSNIITLPQTSNNAKSNIITSPSQIYNNTKSNNITMASQISNNIQSNIITLSPETLKSEKKVTNFYNIIYLITEIIIIILFLMIIIPYNKNASLFQYLTRYD